ncbi:hypothetical protein G6L37_01175 [Agrobacterium rubi]|nr:hypothetical protein [Agrobacterium rubi]NTF24003.1 hypothetical protein [Agrobacterium rubi]
MNGAGFQPFGDDSSLFTVGGLSLENGLSSVVVHGDLVIERDEASLQSVRCLITALQDVEASILTMGPEVAETAAGDVDEVLNPFG